MDEQALQEKLAASVDAVLHPVPTVPAIRDELVRLSSNSQILDAMCKAACREFGPKPGCLCHGSERWCVARKLWSGVMLPALGELLKLGLLKKENSNAVPVSEVGQTSERTASQSVEVGS